MRRRGCRVEFIERPGRAGKKEKRGPVIEANDFFNVLRLAAAMRMVIKHELDIVSPSPALSPPDRNWYVTGDGPGTCKSTNLLTAIRRAAVASEKERARKAGRKK